MKWIVSLATQAEKSLAKVPAKDYVRIRVALAEMGEEPFGGDLKWLKPNQEAGYRRRVGLYRILFDVYTDSRVVKIQSIRRRDETTYRKRQ
jgi:mRNA interferase RelE/StbE